MAMYGAEPHSGRAAPSRWPGFAPGTVSSGSPAGSYDPCHEARDRRRLFGELADPRVVGHLAARAEERGWDGFFVWDHIAYRAPVRAVADPWVALAAVTCATSRVRIGALVTPCPAAGCTR
jgi:alkanesulfonate monooxygenase SsuD/methylene tetrahydromethanopterin reductase-like flavin-dependent oxidoreductase (luciferase family)